MWWDGDDLVFYGPYSWEPAEVCAVFYVTSGWFSTSDGTPVTFRR
jgi:hypothetical protein